MTMSREKYPKGPLVYFAHIGGCTHLIKVGVTSNLRQRVKNFKRELRKKELPETVVILATKECRFREEALLFESFMHHWLQTVNVDNKPYPAHTEYFDFPVKDVVHIDKMYTIFVLVMEESPLIDVMMQLAEAGNGG